MRTISLLMMLALSVSIVACAETVPTPTPEATTVPPSPTSASPNERFEDNESLRNGRFAFIFYLTEIEGYTVPLVNEWTPQTVTEDGSSRSYTFESDQWTMTLTMPLNPGNEIIQAVLSGPQNFHYEAEISPDGTIAPAQ